MYIYFLVRKYSESKYRSVLLPAPSNLVTRSVSPSLPSASRGELRVLSRRAGLCDQVYIVQYLNKMIYRN